MTVAGFLSGVRSGDWLVGERMRFVGWILVAFTAAVLLGLVVTSHGAADLLGRPLGTDFSSFYAAGKLALSGHAADAFNPALLHAQEQADFGAATPFYGWQYPPMFLLLVAPLALLPYGAALAVWQGLTLALYVLTVRGIVRRFAPADATGDASPVPTWLLLALGFPAVFVTLGHGQNAFLSAALIGGGLLLLDRRPLLAGVLFGLLIYKPQLGLMIPVALVADGRWRTIASAAVTVAALAALAAAVFGPDIWRAFLASTAYSRTGLLEAGGPGWEKLQTAFAWVGLWGGPVELAYATQAVVTLAVGAAVFWAWRSQQPYAIKAAALCVGALVGAPFALDYDMMLLAPAIAFLAAEGVRSGFAPYEKTALAVLWIVPMVARTVAGGAFVPVGFIVMATVFVLIVRRLAVQPRLTAASWPASGTPRNSAR